MSRPPILGAPKWLLDHPVISHRGEEGAAPENSLAAFDKAIADGLPIELDVVISKDQHAIVFHDQTLMRMTGQAGVVKDLTLEQIQAASLSNGEKIPTLSQALDFIGSRVPVMIDLKAQLGVSGKQAAVAVGKAIAGRENIGAQLATQSFSPTYLRAVKGHCPDMRRGQLSYFVEDLLFLPWSRPDFVVTNLSSMRFLLGLRRGLGLDIVGWGVQPSDFQNAKKQFKSVIADFEQDDPRADIERLVEAFKMAKEAMSEAIKNPAHLWEARKHLICSPIFEELVKRVDAICDGMSGGMPTVRVVSLSGRVLDDLHQLEQTLFAPASDWMTNLGERIGAVARRLLVKRADPVRDFDTLDGGGGPVPRSLRGS